MNRINLSPTYFPNPTADKAISGANIYIGEINLDPEVIGNQKQVSLLQENGSYVQVSQPVTTGAGGVPIYNGSPVSIYVDGEYSLKVTDSTGAQLYYIPQNDVEGTANQVDTVADLAAIGYAPDDATIFTVLGYRTATDGCGGPFIWDADATDTPIQGAIISVTGITTGRFKRIFDQDDSILTQFFGDYSNGSDNDSPAINAALAYAETVRGMTIRNPTVRMRNGGNYVLQTGITIPYGITLDANGSWISYSGSTVAVTAGDRDYTLNYFTNFINFSLKLNSHTATGVKMLATTESRLKGYVEGYTVGITNTRTSTGIEINGGTTSNASSFANLIEVFSNHCHIGFKVTGTKVGGVFVSGTQPTSNIFLNCSAICDQAYDDESYGWYFDDMGFAGLGSGCVMENCNAESCNTGIYFGDGTRGVNFKGRVEITTTASSRQIIFHANTDNINLSGDGFQIATIGDTAGGIVGFDGSTHTINYDQNGHTRLCGNGTNITSGNPTLAIGHGDIFLKKDHETRIMTMDSGGGAPGENEGGIFIQAGSGSSYGGYIGVYADGHPTNAKNVEIGPSLGGVINFKRYLGAIEILAKLDYQMSATETSLWLFDGSDSTLKRVAVGAEDSGGTGYRLLRIAN